MTDIPRASTTDFGLSKACKRRLYVFKSLGKTSIRIDEPPMFFETDWLLPRLEFCLVDAVHALRFQGSVAAASRLRDQSVFNRRRGNVGAL